MAKKRSNLRYPTITGLYCITTIQPKLQYIYYSCYALHKPAFYHYTYIFIITSSHSMCNEKNWYKSWRNVSFIQAGLGVVFQQFAETRTHSLRLCRSMSCWLSNQHIKCPAGLHDGKGQLKEPKPVLSRSHTTNPHHFQPHHSKLTAKVGCTITQRSTNSAFH